MRRLDQCGRPAKLFPMATRFTLTQGDDPRSTLVVDVCDRMDDEAIAHLRRFMLGYGCASGLIFDATTCVLLRDTFSEMSEASIKVDCRIPTPALLATLGAQNVGPLDVRVGRWLELLVASWQAAIPTEPVEVQELLYDVVPAATGANIHRWLAA